MVQLQDFLYERKIDVACITETKLGSTDKKPEWAGYATKFRHRDYASQARGGGTRILVRHGLQYLNVKCPHTSTTGMEGISVEIATQEGPLIISSIYYSPTNSRLPQQTRTGNEIQQEPRRNEILTRDFNAHHELSDLKGQADTGGNNLADQLFTHGMSVLKTGEPTRRDPRTGSNPAPDITICHLWIWERSQWEVLNSLNSDHKPCISTVHIRSAARERNNHFIWDWMDAAWKSLRGKYGRRGQTDRDTNPNWSGDVQKRHTQSWLQEHRAEESRLH